MFKKTQMRSMLAFLSGMVVAVASIVFLSRWDQAPAAQAADQKVTTDQKEVPQAGRYQTFKLEIPNASAGLLDTATGKVWKLQAMGGDTYKWMPLAEGPR